ncbi:hypothetical protein V8D89_001220 [Ganoderma adspersum]
MVSRPALLDAVSTLMTAQYYTFATFAFVTYDWLINLDEEIRCFWDFSKGRRLTAAALLYGLSRYPPIVLTILQLQTIFPMSDKVPIIPFALTPAVFSAIRVYTLAPERKPIAVVTFLILFVPAFIISMVNATDTPEVLPSPFNCTNNPAPIPAVVGHRLTIAGRICSILGDMIVLFVTWHKTYTTYRAQKGVLKGPSIARVLLYNGSTYFIIITIMNVLESILSQAPSVLALGNFATYASPPLTAILICRFLFDLRQADRTTAAALSPSAIQSLNLNLDLNASVRSQAHGTATLPAFVASMGEPVYTGIRFVDEIGGGEGVPHTNDEGGRSEEDLRVWDDDEICSGDTGRAESV